MPFNKVGPFLQRNATSVNLKDSPIVKLVDPSVQRVKEIREECGPNTLIVIRKYYDNQPLVNPGAEALQWCRDTEPFMLAVLDRNVVYEAGYNEISEADTGRFAAYMEVCQDFLQSNNRGGVYGNHGVGNLNNDNVRPYARLISRFGDRDFWGWHSYWGASSTVENPWHTARWTVVDMLRDVPGLITEAGRDYVSDKNMPRNMWGARGWRRGGIQGEAYLGEIERFSDMLDKYPNIGGASLFLVGPHWQEWSSFESEDIYKWIRTAQAQSKPYFYGASGKPIKPPALPPEDPNVRPPVSSDLSELVEHVDRQMLSVEVQMRVLREALDKLKARINAS